MIRIAIFSIKTYLKINYKEIALVTLLHGFDNYIGTLEMFSL